ncbi:DMT family transporter [Lactiplantibacillus mudanjiangensis]|uniref:EamA family transporter [Lactobacillus sp.] n=1 Tax=Lactiplantibacillus mudanjiangensis TaxID=1296538 RepID=A0A660E2W2_9LACO|nr:DMT family transporter [Lactiplantibacillus mudanjiangensis]VDG18812.1 EamA family transporter [Lactobacillus sp.] [Lactiplantibacillus mudanjiangensis]VDG25099.1 EamA family transporter [Lactobacillus sp.] [Lactiplantibacillus mudanjiangensis]VDG28997.1 EamA family transporter [Lactobacillus sp.] [Lactiplantibacillus mudanjiangensis]VDG32911.1 EamA family transporter [Lactobacillus sp.] [Lactiplantibacillus mudanjiangensis]
MQTSFNRELRGIILASVSATFWGVSGAIAQALFDTTNINSIWLTGVRMLGAGIGFLIYSLIMHVDLWSIWRHPGDLWQIAAYTLLGLMPVQFTYFLAVEASNAATATILQFMGPVFIALWLVVAHHQWPTRPEGLAIMLALIGSFLLVTHGNPAALVISGWALLWGLLSGVSSATNTLLPTKLLTKYSAVTVNTWSMLLGGLLFNLVQPFWSIHVPLTLGNVSRLAFVILFGTLLAFLFFLQSLNDIRPTVASLLDAFEPLAATIIAVTMLGVHFEWLDLFGSLLIISTVFILAIGQRHNDRAADDFKAARHPDDEP